MYHDYRPDFNKMIMDDIRKAKKEIVYNKKKMDYLRYKLSIIYKRIDIRTKQNDFYDMFYMDDKIVYNWYCHASLIDEEIEWVDIDLAYSIRDYLGSLELLFVI